MSRRGRAFTLMEVLLAVALAAGLAGAVMSFAWSLLDRRAALVEHGRRARGASLVLDRIERDLVGAMVAARGGEAGVRGTGTGLRVLSRGVWLGGQGDDRAADLQGSEIRFDAAAGRIVGRRWAGAEASGEEESVCEGVRRLRLRYLVGREWAEAFDSAQAGMLPAAVEVALWFGEPEGDGTQPGEGEAEAMMGTVRGAMPEPDRVRVIAVPDAGEGVDG